MNRGTAFLAVIATVLPLAVPIAAVKISGHRPAPCVPSLIVTCPR